MTVEYKTRYNRGVDLVQRDLKLQKVRVNKIYTPVWQDRAYRWYSPMDTDGILYGERKVLGGEDFDGETSLSEPSFIRVGVILQSEHSTSLTKPNPFGKAFVTELPLGVWVDLKKQSIDQPAQRVRLDEVYVLFIVPKATSLKKKGTSKTAAKNVKLAAEVSTNAWFIGVEQKASEADIAKQITKIVNPWLRGTGRLPGT